MFEEKVKLTDEIPWCDEVRFVLVNGTDAKIYRYTINVSKEYYKTIQEYIDRLHVSVPNVDETLYMITSSIDKYGSVYLLKDDVFLKQVEFEK